jgi:hypothetical protein
MSFQTYVRQTQPEIMRATLDRRGDVFFQAVINRYGYQVADVVRSVLSIPRRDVSDFELALKLVDRDNANIFSAARDFGIVQGDWRRAGLRSRLAELAKQPPEKARAL